MKRPSKSASERRPAMPPLPLHRAPMFGYLLMLTLLGGLLSACMKSIVMIPDAPRCLDYVPEGIWAQTPGAPLPLDDSAGSWVTFGNSQTGQLGIANLKPAAIRHIIGICEQRYAEALAKAERQSRPWWRRL